MKKFFLIAVAALGLVIAAAPSSKAGVSVGIGFGGPFYPGYGPYGYGYPYYYGPGVRFVHRPYYWYHGRRVYRHRWH
jgi:hypothetical protein